MPILVSPSWTKPNNTTGDRSAWEDPVAAKPTWARESDGTPPRTMISVSATHDTRFISPAPFFQREMLNAPGGPFR